MRRDNRCARGHKMTASNTYVRTDGYTACRMCMSINNRDSYYRNKERRDGDQD